MEVQQLSDRYVTLSIRRLAEEFSMARETVSRRLAEANVKPAGQRQGHAVYRIKQAAEALLAAGHGESGDGSGAPIDPKKLHPQDRNAWYQSELKRIQVELETSQLIPAAEVEAALADQLKSLVQFLVTLGDQLERDVALTPEQIESMNQSIDRQRESLYQNLIDDDDVRESA